MKLLDFVYLAVLLGVSSATAQMQVDYYSDMDCSVYVGQIDVTGATNYSLPKGTQGTPECYNNNNGNSVNIGSCSENSCVCDFFNQANCAGDGAGIVASSDVNCLADSSAYLSFACFYS